MFKRLPEQGVRDVFNEDQIGVRYERIRGLRHILDTINVIFKLNFIPIAFYLH